MQLRKRGKHGVANSFMSLNVNNFDVGEKMTVIS